MTRRRSKLPVANPDEVIITRQGEYADIEFRDANLGGMNLKLGPQVAFMTDSEILDCYNEVVRAMEHSVETYRHRAVEVPLGKPQVRYSEFSDQWVPRGDVLRCLIHDDEGLRPVIEIDEREFTLEEFGAMLATYAGWGMRIVFVPDTDLEKPPVIVVKDPKK